MEVQAKYLAQLKDIAGELPIVFAGDLFDRWNAPPELINFALKHLPDGMICIPGQHDLPNHQLDQMHRSGYGVLVEAGKIVDISISIEGEGIAGDGFMIYGFGWGQKIQKPDSNTDGINLAVIHRYCHAPGKSYPGAPAESHFSAFKNDLEGYQAAVFGDNHIGFQARTGECNIINTGAFIRRKSDEKDYQPRIGILYSDGTIKTKFLNTSDEFWTEEKEREELPIDMQAFIKGLEELGEHGLNFKEAVDNYLKENHQDVAEETTKIILQALEA